MSRPLRIAMFLGTFPVISETFILRQITGLLDLGHEVDIYVDTRTDSTAPLQPELASHHLLERTTYMELPEAAAPWEMPVWPFYGRTWLPGATEPLYNFKRLWAALPVLADSFRRTPRLTLQALRSSRYGYQATSLSALYRLARLSTVDKPYDLVHTHFGPTGNSFRFVRRLWRVPLLVSFHGYDVSNVPKRSGPRVYERLFHEMDAATVNSDYMRSGLRALNCPADKLHKVVYGLKLDHFECLPRPRNPGEAVRVLTVGRLVEKKGIEFSLRAFAKVHQRYPQMTYDIVGDGPLKPALERLIGELNLGRAVTLLGAKEATVVRELLARAHIFIMASVTAANGDQAGTPVSLLEAQAAGIPVLSTRHSGIPEIVREGQTGFLVPEKDTETLAKRLQFLVANPMLCLQMGQTGRDFIRSHFSHTQGMRQLLDVYGQLVETPPSVWRERGLCF